MADTVRTLSALQTLLADNLARGIDAQDVRDFLVSVYGITHISTTTCSADSSKDITLTAGYAGGLLLRMILTGSDTDVNLQVGDGTIDTGSNYDFVQRFVGDSAGTTTQDGDTDIPITTISATDAFGEIVIGPGYDSASKNTGFMGRGMLFSGTQQFSYWTNGQYMVDAAIDTLRLTPASGTLTGTIVLFGYGFA